MGRSSHAGNGQKRQCNKPGSWALKRLATCVRRKNFMPPEIISACGDGAAKVRKVLIRFNRMRRKLRNPKPAQIPPRHCLSSKCSDPQDPALGRGAPRVDCQPQGQRRGQRRGVQPGRQAPRERRPGEHGATVGCGRSPGKGCHRHRFHHLRMGQEPGLQPRRPGLGCRERRQPDSDLGRRAGKDLLRSTSERHALLSNTGFTRSTSTGN